MRYATRGQGVSRAGGKGAIFPCLKNPSFDMLLKIFHIFSEF
jgi:hypothetical protein